MEGTDTREQDCAGLIKTGDFLKQKQHLASYPPGSQSKLLFQTPHCGKDLKELMQFLKLPNFLPGRASHTMTSETELEPQVSLREGYLGGRN